MIHEDLSSGTKKEAEEQKSTARRGTVCARLDHAFGFSEHEFSSRSHLGDSIHSLTGTLRRTDGTSIVR